MYGSKPTEGGGGERLVGQQGISEAQERIRRVGRRAALAAGEGHAVQQFTESPEVGAGCEPLHAAQGFEALRTPRAFDEARDLLCRSRRHAAGPAVQDAPLVGELGEHEAPREGEAHVGVVGGAELGSAQHRVLRLAGDQPSIVPAPATQERDLLPFPQQVGDGRGGEAYVPEDEDAQHLGRRQVGEGLPLFLHHEAFTAAGEGRALLRQVERPCHSPASSVTPRPIVVFCPVPQ